MDHLLYWLISFLSPSSITGIHSMILFFEKNLVSYLILWWKVELEKGGERWKLIYKIKDNSNFNI